MSFRAEDGEPHVFNRTERADARTTLKAKAAEQGAGKNQTVS